MKRLFFVVVLEFGVLSCHLNKTENIVSNNDSVPSNLRINNDSLNFKDATNQVIQTISEDSIITSSSDSLNSFFEDSLFANLELEFDTISKSDFDKFMKNSVPSCSVEQSGFIKRNDVIIDGNCDEICENFFVETKSGRKVLLPSDYDAGILGIKTSPSCDKFIIYSSYDGKDYDNYYGHRAEFFVFSNSSKDQGLKAIKPLFKYFANDWSIDNLTWINNSSIAIKIYQEDRWGDGSGLHYDYIKTALK